MKNIFFALISLLFFSCCYWLYSSTPPYATSSQWDAITKQNANMKFFVVAPGEYDDRALWVIEKMSELLNKSGTFYCRLCHSLSKNEFYFLNSSAENFSIEKFSQKQYAFKKDTSEELCYRDAFYLNVDALDSTRFFIRDSIISYFVPKEKIVKDDKNTFTITFTKCDVKGNDRDFYFDCRFSIWDYRKKSFFVRGRLGPYSNMTKFDVASTMADHLVIALGLH